MPGFDEPVDRVHRRALVLDPRDVVRHAIGGLSCLIEPDERAKRLGHRFGGKRNGRLEVADDLPDLCVVLAADSVDFFNQLAGLLHDARVQRVAFLEVFEIFHRDADVQVVRARSQDVLTWPRRLVGDDRLDAGVEERGLQSRQHRLEGLAARPGNRRSILHGSLRGGGKGLRSALQDELARGQVVVWSRVEPEELRVTLDFGQHRRVNSPGVRQDFLEHVAHLEGFAHQRWS
jgi:hypothetical protein